MSADVGEYVASWEEGAHSLTETEAEVARLAAVGAAVAAKCEGQVVFRLVVIDCTGAQTWLADKAAALRGALLGWQVWRETRAGGGGGYANVQLRNVSGGWEGVRELHI